MWVAGAFLGGAEGVFEAAELAFGGGDVDDKAHGIGSLKHQRAEVAHEQKRSHRVDGVDLEKLEGMDLIDLHLPTGEIAHISEFAVAVDLIGREVLGACEKVFGEKGNARKKRGVLSPCRGDLAERSDACGRKPRRDRRL